MEEVYGGARMIRTPRFLACFFLLFGGQTNDRFFLAKNQIVEKSRVMSEQGQVSIMGIREDGRGREEGREGQRKG